MEYPNSFHMNKVVEGHVVILLQMECPNSKNKGGNMKNSCNPSSNGMP